MWLSWIKIKLKLSRSHEEEEARRQLNEASECLKDAQRRADTLQLIVRGMRNKDQWYV